MLHHRHVAVAGLLFHVNFSFFNVLKLNFLVLFGLGVDRWAGEGRVKRRLANWRIAITHELQIELR